MKDEPDGQRPESMRHSGNTRAPEWGYAYTLQGWVKGMNSDLLMLKNDMGEDSKQGGLHEYTARDVFGYSLTYNKNDYQALDPGWGTNTASNFLAKPGGAIDNAPDFHELFNGNIARWTQTLPETNHWDAAHWNAMGNSLTFVYQYDQLNRLLHARASDKLNTSNDWSTINPNLPNKLYKSDYTYDANGNIMTAKRWDQHEEQYDDMAYGYQKWNGTKHARNRLYHLTEPVADNIVDLANDGVEDIAQDLGTLQDEYGLASGTANINGSTSGNNYRYDAIGNLVYDKREQIELIDWTVAGKVKRITRTGGSPLENLGFGYGADGQRIWKKKLGSGTTTFYIRDAQGNIMATYESQPALHSLALTERPLYGSDRVGVDMNTLELYGLTDLGIYKTLPSNGWAGMRRFELKDHLGNVAVEITGDRYDVDQDGDEIVDYYMPKVVGWHGYEPFGSLLPGRNYSSGSYRFGFNSQEKDDEVYGSAGTSMTAEFWQYDTRTGRRWNLDPKPQIAISDYAVMGDNPILYYDPLGDIFKIGGDKAKATADVKSMVKKKYQDLVRVDEKTSEVSIDFESAKGRFTEDGVLNQKGYDKFVQGAMKDDGIGLINGLATATKEDGSDEVYEYSVGLSTAGIGYGRKSGAMLLPRVFSLGDVCTTGSWPATNLSITPYSETHPGDVPRPGVDGAVHLPPGNIYLNDKRLGVSVVHRELRAGLVYHELNENFLRTHGQGMPYTPAHNGAGGYGDVKDGFFKVE